MNCQCAERVTILSLCVCVRKAESWVLRCKSRVSYQTFFIIPKKRQKKKKMKMQKKWKWWWLKHGFFCLSCSMMCCGVWVCVCVCVMDWEEERHRLNPFLILSYFISPQNWEEGGLKYSMRKNSEDVFRAQLMQRKVGHIWLCSALWFADGSKLSE